MRVLVVGGGGREHALAWKLSQSPDVNEVFAAPGNPGMTGVASCVPIAPADIVELGDFAESVNVDLTVVGPEVPLGLGIVDEFSRRGLRIFGPTQAAAELETSKVFAKRFMESAGIPTAEFRVASGREEAEGIVDSGELGWPLVVKADGLAAGKGVVIAADAAEARDALSRVFDERVFGSAGDAVVLERCLTGVEASFHVVTDGDGAVPLASAQDYKRAGDGNEGPNTGGMGSVSPSPLLGKELQSSILSDIVVPTLRGMKQQGRPHRGFLYVGVMVTDEGPMVLEYNCRLGDPEAQVILPRLDGDLLPLLQAAIDGNLSSVQARWLRQAATCVVIASEGYPGKPATGRAITGLDRAGAVEGVHVFCAGVREEENGELVTDGGRVVGVTALSPSLATARTRAYEAAEHVRFEGAWFRRDIGSDVLERLKGG